MEKKKRGTENTLRLGFYELFIYFWYLSLYVSIVEYNCAICYIGFIV